MKVLVPAVAKAVDLLVPAKVVGLRVRDAENALDHHETAAMVPRGVALVVPKVLLPDLIPNGCCRTRWSSMPTKMAS